MKSYAFPRRRRLSDELFNCGEDSRKLLTRFLPTARLPHHATNAVYPTASPHVVLCPGFSRKRAKARRAGFFLRRIQLLVRLPKAPSNSGQSPDHGESVHRRTRRLRPLAKRTASGPEGATPRWGIEVRSQRAERSLQSRICCSCPMARRKSAGVFLSAQPRF